MKIIDAKQYEQLNLRIGQIKAVQKHPKLEDYILLIDLGPVERDMQIVADLKDGYTMEQLQGKQVIFLENFEPTEIEGVESQGLLLITHKEGKPVLLTPEQPVQAGVKVAGIQDTERCYHFKEGEHGK